MFKIPYSLYLAHGALIFFKITLKIPGKIASQLAHSENEHLSWLCLLSEVKSDTFLGNGE